MSATVPPTATVDPTALLPGLRKALAGPLPMQGDDGLFPKGAAGKKLAEAAKAAGWVVERAEKAGKKRVVVGELTDAGRRHVLDADDPRPVLEALLPVLQRIADDRAAPAAGPEPLGRSVSDATAACVKAIEDAFARLQKSIEGEFAKLHKSVGEGPAKMRPSVEAALGRLGAAVTNASPAPTSSGASDAQLAAVIPVLREVLTRLGTRQVPTVPATPPPPPAVRDAAAKRPADGPPETFTAEQVRQALKAAYDELCLYVEFRDRLVEIPRLYRDVARRLPGLTVERFHRELEALRDERRVELHVLNEVHAAKDPDLAIWKNDRLYYFVIWK